MAKKQKSMASSNSNIAMRYEAKFGHPPPQGMPKDAMERWINSAFKKAPAPEGAYGPKGSIADKTGRGDAHAYKAEKSMAKSPVGSPSADIKNAMATAPKAKPMTPKGKAGLAVAALGAAATLVAMSRKSKADDGKANPDIPASSTGTKVAAGAAAAGGIAVMGSNRSIQKKANLPPLGKGPTKAVLIGGAIAAAAGIVGSMRKAKADEVPGKSKDNNDGRTYHPKFGWSGPAKSTAPASTPEPGKTRTDPYTDKLGRHYKNGRAIAK